MANVVDSNQIAVVGLYISNHVCYCVSLVAVYETFFSQNMMTNHQMTVMKV